MRKKEIEDQQTIIKFANQSLENERIQKYNIK